MNNPKIEINLPHFRDNIRTIVDLCKDEGIEVAAVTKAFCAMPDLAQVYADEGCAYLADSRVENLKNLQGLGLPLMMLRLPMKSEAADVVRYADVSLNSELDTMIELDKAAKDQGKRHSIILMMDLGDLREGYYDEYELFSDIEIAQRDLHNLDFVGVGVNLTCFGGILPDRYNLLRLVTLSKFLKDRFGLKISIVSGGNSSTLHLLLDNKRVEGINQLRIGEGFLLGRETAYGQRIPGTHDDVFSLVVEIVELKTKPSIPRGIMGKNAFGEVPVFEDQGNRQVAICALGKQDVDIDKIAPLDPGIVIKGASSDHMVLDITEAAGDLKVGSEVRFSMEYGGLLSAMTSQYVGKQILDN